MLTQPGLLTQHHIDRIRQLQQQVTSAPAVNVFIATQSPARRLLEQLTNDLGNHLSVTLPHSAMFRLVSKKRLIYV